VPLATSIEEATGIALARGRVDFSAFQRRNVEVEEHWLMPRYEEAQFVAAAREAGLRVEPRADGLWRIEALIEEGFPQDRIERIGLLKLDSDIRAHKNADAATGEVFVKRIAVKGRLRGQPARLITNEWYEAQQLAENYWLYVVWSPLGDSP
jgi:hypothetical protein